MTVIYCYLEWENQSFEISQVICFPWDKPLPVFLLFTLRVIMDSIKTKIPTELCFEVLRYIHMKVIYIIEILLTGIHQTQLFFKQAATNVQTNCPQTSLSSLWWLLVIGYLWTNCIWTIMEAVTGSVLWKKLF